MVPQPQDHARATLAPILKKEDGRVDWSRGAAEIANRARGFTPWPGAFTFHGGRLLKAVRVLAPAEGDASAGPGTVVSIGRAGVDVACGAGTRLRLLEVQPESRRAMPAPAWAAGARLRPGARLG